MNEVTGCRLLTEFSLQVVPFPPDSKLGYYESLLIATFIIRSKGMQDSVVFHVGEVFRGEGAFNNILNAEK